MPPIRPILTSLRHHRAGAILIALQVALTLAVVCNAMFVIRQRLDRLVRPTGIAENELVLIRNTWVGPLNEVPARLASDLAALRSLPAAADAVAMNAFPLVGSGWQSGVRRQEAMPNFNGSGVAVYFVDDHALRTLGVRLVEGRNFSAQDVVALEENGSPDGTPIIITQTLARQVFPDGNVLGKPLYIGNSAAKASIVIGIIDSLQTPFRTADRDDAWQDVILVPKQPFGKDAFFMVRAKPGQRDSLIAAIPAALKAVSPRRVLSERGVMTFAQLRDDAYRNDRGLAWMLAGICITLLVVTAAGIVGLTSFWVGQRRRQIGIRRALGATRRDILLYFLTENGLISVAGAVIGIVLAFGVNVVMMREFETTRLSGFYVAAGVVVLLALGQLAVLAPARRASRVPPVEATRTI